MSEGDPFSCLEGGRDDHSTTQPRRDSYAAYATTSGSSVDHRSVAAGILRLAFGLSWALWLVPILGATEVMDLAAEIGALFGPTVAAAIVSWRVGVLRAWTAGIVRWRVPLRWWGLALGLPLVYVLLLHLGLVLLGSTVLDLTLITTRAASYLPVLVLTSIAMGGLNEEPGWRGFALPRLQQRFTATRATLILGIAWALWHLPALVLAAQAGHGLETAAVVVLTRGRLGG